MTRRHRQPSRKLQLEALEPRQLLSRGDEGPLHVTAALAGSHHHARFQAESAPASRPDLDDFAHNLVQHRRMAARQGLGALAMMLGQHRRMAARQGWGACLVMVLEQHPAYAARHHLTGLLTPPATDPTGTPAPLATLPQVVAVPAPSPTADPAPASTSTATSATAPVPITPVSPPVTVGPRSVAVGGTLDVTIHPGGLVGQGVTYTITPQPLPANMVFNRGTGELVFAPAPGQDATLSFSVTASDGVRTAIERVPITVTAAQRPSTEVSGQVVDESGRPLAHVPVMIDDRMTETDTSGNFTLGGISPTPGPLTVDGLQTATADRMMLMAPVTQLLAHPLYDGVTNAVAKPIILPRLDVAHATDFRGLNLAKAQDVTSPALPGFKLTLPASSAMGGGGAPFAGKMTLTKLPAATIGALLPPGVVTDLIEVDAVGLRLGQPVQVTMPNTSGAKPGSLLDLYSMNWTTGGHDLVGHLVVSPDGTSMTSVGGVALSPGVMPMGAMPMATAGGSEVQAASFPDPIVSVCLFTADGGGGVGQPISGCGCQATDGDSFDSEAGLVTGEYFQDHATVTYQSQGQARGLDFQYSSLQADAMPVVQVEPSTQAGSNSDQIVTITAQLTVGGVVQGSAATYDATSLLQDGTFYRVPLQFDASQLATGAYPYAMDVTQVYSDNTSALATYRGLVNVVNGTAVGGTANPLGAGWSLGGIQRVDQTGTDGPALITAGSQGTERFDSVYVHGETQLQDLAAASYSGTRLMANDGMGMFTTGAATTNDSVIGVASGDFDGDGKPDMAEVSQSTMTVELNDGAGGFSAGSTATPLSSGIGEAITVGDFDGDGTRDIAVVVDTGSGYDVEVYTGNGDGTFAGPVTTALGNGSGNGDGDHVTTAVGDFNGDGKDDLAVTTADGLLDVVLASSSGGGALTAATSVTLPTGHLAVSVALLDYNADGEDDLVINADDTTSSVGFGDFAALDVFAGDGLGGFSFTSTYAMQGHPYPQTGGLVVGDFTGDPGHLQVAVPIHGDYLAGPDEVDPYEYVDLVPLSSSGVWGPGVLVPLGQNPDPADSSGTIVAADFNGDGKLDLALTHSDDPAGGIKLLLTDPGANQFLPVETIAGGGLLAAGPFAGTAAVPGFSGPMDDTSRLAHNGDGTWTRTYPDGSVVQFDTAGRETSTTDRNGNTTSYAYLTSGPAAGALSTITDPVGLVTTLAYDANGRLDTVTDPASRVTDVSIDANGNLTQITDPDGATWQYGYATPANHLITTETNPNNYTATASYDGFGRLTGETLFDGTSTSAVTGGQSQGLIAPGASGTLPLASNYTSAVTDPNGHATSLTFDGMGMVASSVDATNQTTTTTRDMNGWPDAVTDPLGRTTSYTYDMMGNVTTITRPETSPGAGDSTTETIAYDPTFNVPTSITDFRGLTTTYTLDTHGNVTRRTDPDLLYEDYTYNTAGQMLTDTDRNGHTTTYTYDTSGRLATVTYPGTGSPTVTYGYDAAGAGNVTSITDELNHTTSFTYDAANRLLTAQDPVQAAASVMTTYAYDDAGNLTSMTDALGHVTTYTYDARNRLTGLVDPVNQGTGLQTTYGYDAASNLTSMTDPLGHATTYGYDADNRPTTITDALNHATTYGYDEAGQRTSVTDANNITTTFDYDGQGRLLDVVLPPRGEIDSDPVTAWTYTYDADDNVIQKTDALGDTWTYTYDDLNRLASETSYPDGTDPVTTTYGYDAVGNRTSVTDPLGHVTTYTYDERNRLASVTEPSGGGTTAYAYDAHSRLTSVTDPVSNVTSYGYDDADRVTTETDPLNHTTTYTYDVVGDLTSKSDRDGRETDYGYDADNRRTTETWVGSSPSNTITTTYDAAGRRTGISDSFSEYAFTYDDANRLATVDNFGTPNDPNVVLTYGYDAVGNRITLSDSLGGENDYTYDEWYELTSLAQWGTGVADKRVSFEYDQAGRRTRMDRYSNLDPDLPEVVMTTTYTYDFADRLTGLSHALPDLTVVASYGYTLDDADRLTEETRTWDGGSSSDTLDYTYTNNNQLTGVTHTNTSFANESFSYDANGNRTMTGYSTGTGNELTSDGTYTYTYDDEGNLLTRTAIATGDERLYTWDYRNRLVEVDQVVGGVQSVLALYTYDALDRRIGVEEGGSATWTVYDGMMPLLDFDGAGTETARYLDGPSAAGVDAVLARETPAGGVAWYLPDRLGTIRDLVDNSGVVIDHVDYGVYGGVTGETNPSVGDEFKYAGMRYDATVQLYSDQARWYDPATGRFISMDPIGISVDQDLFRYVANNPINNLDNTGLYTILFGKYGKEWSDYQISRIMDSFKRVDARIVTLLSQIDNEIESVRKNICMWELIAPRLEYFRSIFSNIHKGIGDDYELLRFSHSTFTYDDDTVNRNTFARTTGDNSNWWYYPWIEFNDAPGMNNINWQNASQDELDGKLLHELSHVYGSRDSVEVKFKYGTNTIFPDWYKSAQTIETLMTKDFSSLGDYFKFKSKIAKECK